MCKHSSPEKGLCFSDEALEFMDKIKAFNYKNIYFSDKLKPSLKYFDLIINEIFDTLSRLYDGKNTINNLAKYRKFYPTLIDGFSDWLCSYWNMDRKENLKNEVIFDIENQKDYYRSILFYISGMTDNYAIDTYNEIIGF